MSVKEDTNDVFKNLFLKEKKKSNIISSHPKKKENMNEENMNEENINEENINEENINEENIDEENIDEENDYVEDNFQMKKKLAANITKLEKFEQIQIYHIIKNKGEKFTKNQNGILFDLCKFDNSTIKSLDSYVKMTTTYRKQNN